MSWPSSKRGGFWVLVFGLIGGCLPQALFSLLIGKHVEIKPQGIHHFLGTIIGAWFCVFTVCKTTQVFVVDTDNRITKARPIRSYLSGIPVFWWTVLATLIGVGWFVLKEARIDHS